MQYKLKLLVWNVEHLGRNVVISYRQDKCVVIRVAWRFCEKPSNYRI